MNSTEKKLKERIKELTCLYEVTSIIVHSDFSVHDKTFEAIIRCLQRAWSFPDDVQVVLNFESYHHVTNPQKGKLVTICEDIKLFNEVKGNFE